MQQFIPTHYTTTFGTYFTEGVVITENGNIVVCNNIKDKIITEKYVCLHANQSITYKQLIAIDIAISVVFTGKLYVILLNDGTILYIIKSKISKSIDEIKKFNTSISEINVEYLGASSWSIEFSIFSQNVLYIVMKNKLNIIEIDDVFGYMYHDYNLLYTNSENIIMSKNLQILEIINYVKFDKYNSSGTPDSEVLQNVNVVDVRYICMSNFIIIVILANEDIVYYTWKNGMHALYKILMNLKNVKTLEIFGNKLICMLTTKTLIVYECCLVYFDDLTNSVEDVEDYFRLSNYVVCRTILDKSMLATIDPEFTDFESFLIEYGNSIKTISIYNDLRATPQTIIYVDLENTLRVYNIINSQFNCINSIFDISHLPDNTTLKELRVNACHTGSYI